MLRKAFTAQKSQMSHLFYAHLTFICIFSYCSKSIAPTIAKLLVCTKAVTRYFFALVTDYQRMKKPEFQHSLLLFFSTAPLLALVVLASFGIPANASNGFLGGGGSSSSSSSSSGSGGGGGGSSQWTGSFVDHQEQVWFKTAPQVGKEVKAESLQKQEGQDPTEKYGPVKQGGMSPGSKEPEAEVQPPEPVAKKAQPDQQPPKNPHHKEMTDYKNMGGGHGLWGPPNPALGPFRHHPNNPSSLGAPANVATNENLPSWMKSGAGTTSNGQAMVAAANAAHQGANEMNNPSIHTSQAQMQGGIQHTGDATENAANAQFGSNVETVRTSLINVASESAGSQTSASASKKTLNQAVWMVQQMFKGVYIPMAVLFLLPGAVATQTMSLVKYGVVTTHDEDTNPFSGFMRALVSLFLIFSTQLIVSYSIDVGNSLTYEVTQQMNPSAITSWADALLNPNSGQSAKQREETAQKETSKQAVMRSGFGIISTLLNYGLMVLAAYQVVMACYLYLLGPIAASFLAWPSGVGRLFRPVFSNWLEGLLNLVLWRFWWCVILLCMSTRIQWLQETGGYDPKSPWEPIVFIAFGVMLTYIPFMALDFRPGDMVDQLLEKTGASGGGEGGGGGGKKPGHARPHHGKAA